MTREVKAVDGSKPTVVTIVLVHGQVIVNYQAKSSRYTKVGAEEGVGDLKGVAVNGVWGEVWVCV
jgi:hypothetical protein